MYKIFVFLTSLFGITIYGQLTVGFSEKDFTPPLNIPSAGYVKRMGKKMLGVHDPLLITAMYINNGEKELIFCGIDHFGFDYSMVQEIKNGIRANSALTNCEVFISSSHTHSGGGGFLNYPYIGPMLAGEYNSSIRSFYINSVVEAGIEAANNRKEAKIGMSSITLKGLSLYRSFCPKDVEPLDRLVLMKITDLDDNPMGLLYNFALHPTTLTDDNLYFSADFVGSVRKYLSYFLGSDVIAVFVNGAQGDLIPNRLNETNDWIVCDRIGSSIGNAIETIWDLIPLENQLSIQTKTIPYEFDVIETPHKIKIPISSYKSEISIITLNSHFAILTVPGELSCVYDKELTEYGKQIGFDQITVFGLTNDAHGYIITPMSWESKTMESMLSFGGKEYGKRIVEMIKQLLNESINKDAVRTAQE